MKKPYYSAIWFLLLSVLSACSPLKVTVDYDKNVEFKEFKTYMILPWRKENSKLVNEIDKRRLYDALNNELSERGYQQVKSDADLAVNLMVIIQEKSNVTAYKSHYNYGGYYYPYGYGYSNIRYDSQEYLQGTVIIDIFDNKAKKLIWQGAAVAEIDENPRNREKRIPRAMDRIFWEYPVKKIKK
jgi:hypothetical protein